jgi:hypothetical protein
MAMMRKSFSLALIAGMIWFTSCDVLQQVAEMAAFTKCQFRLSTVENLSLAGVNIQQKKKLTDLSFTDAAKVTAAFATGNLPLSLTLNVQVKNPNAAQASMNKLDWILLIDGIEMVSGVNQNRVNVPANGGVATLPLKISVDLNKALSGKSKDAILNFGFNLAGVGNQPTRITLKAKPSIVVGNQTLDYPGYLSVENEFK